MSDETKKDNTNIPKDKIIQLDENLYVYSIPYEPVPYCNNPSRKGWTVMGNAKTAMELSLLQQHQNRKKYTSAISMVIDFYMPAIQKSQLASSHFEDSWHRHTPDILQLTRFVTQAACGILYDDDCIISSLTTLKHFSKNPRTVFTIRELK